MDPRLHQKKTESIRRPPKAGGGHLTSRTAEKGTWKTTLTAGFGTTTVGNAETGLEPKGLPKTQTPRPSEKAQAGHPVPRRSFTARSRVLSNRLPALPTSIIQPAPAGRLASAPARLLCPSPGPRDTKGARRALLPRLMGGPVGFQTYRTVPPGYDDVLGLTGCGRFGLGLGQWGCTSGAW